MEHAVELILKFRNELLQVGITVVAAGLTVIAAIFLYFRQRHYEMIVDRYLNEGIDLIQAELQESVQRLAHNWARWLEVLKEYREFSEEFDLNNLRVGFIEHRSGRFNYVAHCRLLKITKSSEIYTLYLMAIQSLDSANSRLASEFPSSIAFALKSDRVTMGASELAARFAAEAEEIWKKNQKWHYLITELQYLSEFLEQRRLSYSKLDRLHKNRTVKNIVKQIKDRFAEELDVDSD